MRQIFATMFVFVPLLSYAHHSPNVHFDRNDLVEIEGVLKEFQWQNPHIQLTITVVDEDGNESDWIVDEVSAIAQSRRGVSPDEYRVGSEIKVAGFRGRRNRTAIFATNTLLSSGRELVGGQSAGARWSPDNAVGADGQSVVATADYSEGLFRVWGRDRSAQDRSGRGGSQLWNASYPLTPWARDIQSGWDPVADNPYLRCQNGMPAIMDSGHPMQIEEDGESIVIRMEELDVERVVNMGGNNGAAASAGPYGRSAGSWDGDTLVVTTTDIDWPWFDQLGVPQSDELELVERFSVSDDGLRLLYTVTARDPQAFTEPVVLTKSWISAPELEISDYECSWNRADL